MCKGTNCLSKWVSEAEHQLCLLFKEARNCQPTIIFFNEIDGLAPVCSLSRTKVGCNMGHTVPITCDTTVEGGILTNFRQTYIIIYIV